MKSVPGTLFFKPMKEEPTVFPFGPFAEMFVAKNRPYTSGEKCLDKSTGEVVTIVSCEPMKISEVTVADAETVGVVAAWDSLHVNQQEHLKEKYRRDAIGEDDLFYLLWRHRHPGKEWCWRVNSQPFGITE